MKKETFCRYIRQYETDMFRFAKSIVGTQADGEDAMQWYSHLYVGKKAKRHRYAIIQGIREEKLQPEVYVITSPQNGENLCDIYPSAMLLFPSEKKKERMILGIAVTYWEALEVARRMVDDLYQKTGEVSAEAFARFTGIDVW